MKEIVLKDIIEEKKPGLLNKVPAIVRSPFLGYLNGLFRLKPINKFIRENDESVNFDYIEKIFELTQCTYSYLENELEKVPATGNVVIMSNHPLGALDGLAMLAVVGKRRPDIKIVVNDVLNYLENVNDLFLPVDLFNVRSQRRNLLDISSHMREGKAIIFFPAGMVSRKVKGSVQDPPWTKGAIGFARKFKSPILPTFIDAKNSWLFYNILKINNDIAPLLFPREMFNAKGSDINIKFGDLISPDIFEKYENDVILTELIRKAVYNIDNPPNEIIEYYAE